MSILTDKMHVCSVISRSEIARDTVTLRLELKNKTHFDFKPGQYVLLSLSKEKTSPGKMYTISSAPGKSYFELTIRKIGPFSTSLYGLAVGTEVYVQGPYGGLCHEPHMTKPVFIAGGVGITPFMSMIEHFVMNSAVRPTEAVLIYSNKTIDDIAFRDELDKAAHKWPHLKVVHTLTRDDRNHGKDKGRINIHTIKKYCLDIADRDYFICGSIDFCDAMWAMLLKNSVPENRIFVETFY